MSDLKDIFDIQISKPRAAGIKKPPAFKPSALGSPCARKLYYSYHRVPEDFGMPINVLRICRMGDAVHDMLNKIYYDAGVLIQDEVRLVDEELELSAYIDAMFELDGELWIGEYKSINSRGFGYLKGPKPEHNIQAMTYLYVFNKQLKDGKFPKYEKYKQAVGIKFIYVNRDNSQMQEFTVLPDDELFGEIINKIFLVREHTSKNTLPEKTKDWCNSCPWRQKCEDEFVI